MIFKKINKTDKPLTKLSKKKKKKIKITNMRNESQGNTRGSSDINSIIKVHHKQLYRYNSITQM